MGYVLQRRPDALAYGIVVLMSLYAGVLIARSPGTLATPIIGLLAISGAVIALSLPIELVFLGWLFVAPIFQNDADQNTLGRALTWGFYIGPVLVFVALMFFRRRYALRLTPIDWLPAAYVVFVVASMWLASDTFQTDPVGSLKAILTIVALGPIVYYFLTLGPGIDIPASKIIGAVLAAAGVQGAFAIIDYAVGWNLWGSERWKRFEGEALEGGARAVGTLVNPGVLGMFLGAGVVLAVAALVWGGPRSWRRWCWLVLALCVPGLLATLTRGPILATAAAVVLLLLLGRARLLGFAVILSTATAIALVLPSLEKTDVYRERVTQQTNIDTRVALRDLSLELAAQKPLLGWGHGSFDEVKNASDFRAEGIPISSIIWATSHDTYLTILVELGAVGLLLFALPFVVLALRGVRAARSETPEKWVLVGSLASLLAIYGTASTLDFRFFSIAFMLPFVLLALIRRATAEELAPATSPP